MTMPAPRYTLFDKDGYFLTDIRTFGVFSWTLPSRGVIGQGNFNLSHYEPKNRKKYIDFGKYILRRQSGVIDWLGIIYTPRNWPYSRTTFRAYQPTNVLAWRRTPTIKISGTAGNLFRQTLEITNGADYNEKIIYPNSIYEGDGSRDETLGNDALSHMMSVAQRSRNDFSVTHDFDDNGRLYLKGNWYNEDGIDTNRYLREGYNIQISDNLLEENGELYNDVWGMNDGKTAKTRITSHQWNDAAIAEYGLYQKNIIFSGAKTQATVDQNTLSQLRKTVEASRVFDLQALNVGDTYNYLAPGNRWNVDLNEPGYDGDGYGTREIVKVLGMEIDDALPEKMRLVTEVY